MSRVEIRDATLEDLLHITHNMRAVDREEIYATHWREDPEWLAEATLQCGDMQWVACLDGVPAASFGGTPLWPNVWSVWAFGTDDWRRVVLSVTKHVRRFMLPAIFRSGAHRLQCYSHSAHTEAHRWLESFGGSCEAVLVGFGSRRENFMLYTASPESVQFWKKEER